MLKQVLAKYVARKNMLLKYRRQLQWNNVPKRQVKIVAAVYRKIQIDEKKTKKMNEGRLKNAYMSGTLGDRFDQDFERVS